MLFSLNMPFKGWGGVGCPWGGLKHHSQSPSCSHPSIPLLPLLASLYPESPCHSWWLLPCLSYPSLPTKAQIRANGFGGVSGILLWDTGILLCPDLSPMSECPHWYWQWTGTFYFFSWVCFFFLILSWNLACSISSKMPSLLPWGHLLGAGTTSYPKPCLFFSSLSLAYHPTGARKMSPYLC